MPIRCAAKTCRRYFRDKDALLEHWNQRSSNEHAIPDHFHCKECVKLFESKQAAEAHQLQANSAFQSCLECPWCKWSCGQLSSFVGHYELNQCPIIGKDTWKQMREDKLAVSVELQKRHNGEDPDLINDPREGVVGSRRPDAPPISELSALRPAASATVRPNPVQLNYTEFPSLPSQASGAGRRGNAVQTEGGDSALSKVLFPEAPPPARPTPQQLATATTPAVRKENVYAEHDPANPNFNSHAYYEPILEMFKCPVKFCMKKFKTVHQFKGHLTSAHQESVRYQCPRCLRYQDTSRGLAAHIENPRAKCTVRKTREYGHLVSQLSCGLVELNKNFVLQDDMDSDDDDDDSYFGGGVADGSTGPAEFVMSHIAQKPKPARLTAENLEGVDELAQAVDQRLNFTDKTDEQLEKERDMEEQGGFW